VRVSNKQTLFLSIILKVMFEAKLLDGTILKRIVDAIKDLVTDVNIDATPTGLSL
jgi:hypothetical protein